jgi:hypothetical protein
LIGIIQLQIGIYGLGIGPEEISEAEEYDKIYEHQWVDLQGSSSLPGKHLTRE